MAHGLPTRLQAAAPPCGQQLRERQARHIGWQGDTDSQGKVAYMNPHWKDPAKAPTVIRAHQMLSWYDNQGIFTIPRAYTVSYFNGGAYSVLFRISTGEAWVEEKSGREVPADVLLRISCAWAPYYGTESEVATMTYVSRKGGVSVPEVYFFDSSAANPFGYEFTIMQLVQDAETVDESRYRDSKDMEDRVMVEFRKLWGLEFGDSGSIYCDWATGDFFMGPMVLLAFFCPSTRGFTTAGSAIGPFATWEQYARALLDARESLDPTAIRTVGSLSSKDLVTAAAGNNIVSDHLRAEIDMVSGLVARDDSSEPGLPFKPRLVHHDMHMGNILVRKTLRQCMIAAVIDWEGVVVRPAGLIENVIPKALDSVYSSYSDGIRAKHPHVFPEEYYAAKAREARRLVKKFTKI